MATPYSVKVLNETSSTQDEARRQFTPGTPSVVVAHRQSVGRGRSGAEWLNAPRSLAVSVAFRPTWDSGSWPLIPLIAGLAARQVMEPTVSLKWPNDVEKDGDKVAGILVEASAGGDGDGGSVVIAGMGANLYWPDAPVGMAGLRGEDPGSELAPRLGVAWATALLQFMDAPSGQWPRADYREACSTLGRSISWEPAGTGLAVDIGEDGSLVVETADGVRRLTSGAVRHVRPHQR